MKREDLTTLKIGDDFSKAFAPFEEHLARLCIHGECRMPCVMWDGEKKRCSLKHQARLMHRAPKNNGARAWRWNWRPRASASSSSLPVGDSSTTRGFSPFG